jgi:hypothetical protein
VPVKTIALLLLAALTAAAPHAIAQEAPPAEAAPAPEAPPAPNPDAVLEEIAKIGPEALFARINELKQQLDSLAAEAEAARLRAEETAAQYAAVRAKVEAFEKLMASFQAAMTPPAEAAPAPEQMAMAEAAPTEAAPPAEMPAAETAPAPAPNAITYAEHVLPILQARCFRCHSNDTQKGGLNVATYQAILTGGASGAVITPGNPEGSRLLRLVAKLEEPYMPPSGDPLTEEQIATLRAWVEGGAPLDAAAAAQMAAAKAEAAAAAATTEATGPYIAATFATTPPLPEIALPAPTPLPVRGVVARAIATSTRAPIAAVGGNREVILYNLDNLSVIGALPFPEGDIFSLGFSVNGEYLIAGGGQEGASGLCVVWKVRSGERLGTYAEAYDTVLTADLSPDDRLLATGGPDKKVRVYSVQNGAELYKLDPHTDWITALKFTPDGELLVTADRQGGMYAWQAANGRPVEQLRGHEGSINALAFTLDSQYLVSVGDDGTAQVWDTWTYQRVRSFKAHNQPVLNVDVYTDGRIVTCSLDGTARMWNLEGKELRTFSGLNDWVYQARFGRGGAIVLAGTWTGDIFPWNAETGEALPLLSTNVKPPQG